MTIYGILEAIQNDVNGYVIYVFKILEDNECQLLGYKNLTCVRFPNWECRELKIGDMGYVNFEFRRAGIDCWYNGEELIPYRNNIVQFMNFIFPGKNKTESCIM